MKPLDLKSLLVAGAIGAALMYLLTLKSDPTAPVFTTAEAIGYGFALGAGVQIGVRLTGVS